MPTNSSNYKGNSSFSILSKGVSGSGKTIAACGKRFRPVYVFDCDQRMKSVINYYTKLDGHWNDLNYDTFTMGQDFNKLDRQMDSLLARPEYKTVVLASLASYIHIVLAHVLKIKSGTSQGKKIAGIQVNSIEDYNVEDAAIIFELLGMMKQLQAQGTNVIIEAHIVPLQINNLDGSSYTKMELLTKGTKGPAQIPGYFDEAWWFKRKIIPGQPPKFIMDPKGDNTIDAKTSCGLTEIDFTDKDFTELLFSQLNIK
jgi:hypothetical protein